MITGSVLAIILLLTVGLFVPLRWFLRVWLEDRAISTPLALAAMAAHFVLYTLCAFTILPLAVLYCALLLLFIGISPYLDERNNRKALRHMAEEDIEKYERILQRDPNHVAAHAALAGAFLVCERFDEAIAEYERAIELDPQNSRSEIPRLKRARELKEAYEERQRRRRRNTPNEKPPTSREA
jgi:tetratricopeptide (TPR) repeat protein